MTLSAVLRIHARRTTAAGAAAARRGRRFKFNSDSELVGSDSDSESDSAVPSIAALAITGTSAKRPGLLVQ
jgi:hypothetical protein